MICAQCGKAFNPTEKINSSIATAHQLKGARSQAKYCTALCKKKRDNALNYRRRNSERTTFPCVYLMKKGELHKIGVSKNPKYRAKALGATLLHCGQPNHLAESIEASLHQMFAAKQVTGEWFNLTDEDAKKVLSLL